MPSSACKKKIKAHHLGRRLQPVIDRQMSLWIEIDQVPPLAQLGQSRAQVYRGFLFSRSALLRHLHSFPTRRSSDLRSSAGQLPSRSAASTGAAPAAARTVRRAAPRDRSEEHTSELQSQSNFVCRLLLVKKR